MMLDNKLKQLINTMSNKLIEEAYSLACSNSTDKHRFCRKSSHTNVRFKFYLKEKQAIYTKYY